MLSILTFAADAAEVNSIDMFYFLALLSPCAVCLVGAAWLFCNRKNNTRAQSILSLFLLFSSVSFFCLANNIAGGTGFAAYRALDIIDSFITLLVIPSMYLYYRSLTSENSFTWKDYIWILPAIVVGVGTCVLYLAMSDAETKNYIRTVLIERRQNIKLGAIYELHRLISIGLYKLTVIVQILVVGVYIAVNLASCLRRLLKRHPGLEASRKVDSKVFFWFMLTIPFVLGVIFLKRAFWVQYPVLTGFYFMGWSVMCFGVLYHGSKNKYAVENLAVDFSLRQVFPEAVCCNDDMPPEGETENGIVGEKLHPRYAEHLARFNKLMGEEQIFLQNYLRADEVAIAINTNRTYLSRMIKREFDCTFSDYTNRKRIEYAQELMRENPQIKQNQLAEQSGFLSASTFCKTFKAMMGETSKEWIRREVMKNELSCRRNC